MDIQPVRHSLKKIISTTTPETYLTDLPFLGVLSFTTAHKIQSICPIQTAIIFVLDGTKVVTRGEERIEMRQGEGFVFPALMETTVENIPDEHSKRYSALCLIYDENMIARVANTQTKQRKTLSSDLNSFRIPFDESIEKTTIHLMEMAAEHAANERLLCLCREELLLLVTEKIGCIMFLWQAASSWSSRCSAIIAMAPEREWTVQALAEKLNTSERSLRRYLSNEQTGFTHILREVRLNAGLALLQNGKTSVGETAYRCGYNSASRFAGLFKERFGISPSDVLSFSAVSGHALAGS